MKTDEMRTVTVIGAGTMGAQISYRCAKHGYAVRLLDTSLPALEKAQATHRGWASQEIPDPAIQGGVLRRIQASSSLEEAVQGTDFVIEAAPEDLELKRRLFEQLDRLCPPEVILTSNSSSLRMSRIETGVKNRGRVCNLHFFQSPSPAIEIMGGSATTGVTVERIRQFAVSLGLIPFVLRQESTGFLYNRIWRALKREVLHEVAEGVASPEDIDRVVMLMWRWDKGPFAWMDLVGLDVIRDIEMVYYGESGDPRDKPPAYLDQMIAEGKLGAKTGKGFYTYPQPAYEQPGWLLGTGQTVPGKTLRREDVIGSWRLVSFQATRNGQTSFPLGEDATGLLMYSSTGQMSVSLSQKARLHFASADLQAATPDETRQAFATCLSYCGTFEIRNGTMIHRIEQCTFPNWVGTDQVRFCRLEGNRLTLETPPLPMGGQPAVSRLVWQRVVS